ncbi:hypothetical protein, partial [Mesorhizobium sp. M0244]|uniref:hypothetical protein n=1 Tax=Mesorhizobium sp. M0244 TaxID=2956926 RepID=UPI003335BECD
LANPLRSSNSENRPYRYEPAMPWSVAGADIGNEARKGTLPPRVTGLHGEDEKDALPSAEFESSLTAISHCLHQ